MTTPQHGAARTPTSPPLFAQHAARELDTWRAWHGLAYQARLLPNILRAHRLKAATHGHVYAQPFTLTERLHAQWRHAFQAPTGHGGVLQTCHVHLSRDYLFTTLARLGLNFANVMHLGVRLGWEADFHGYKARQPYVFHARLKACVRMGERRVALDFETEITTLSGRSLMRQDDTMLVDRLPPALLDRLAPVQHGPDATWYEALRGLRHAQPHLRPDHASARQAIVIPVDQGRRYGQLSGDLNPLHTQHWLARRLGHPAAFVQGLYTANLMLAHLRRHQPANRHLAIRFCRPVFTGQTVELLSDAARCELHDARRQLLVSASMAAAEAV